MKLWNNVFLPKLGRFYLLPKIHKQLHNAPGRSVISNGGFFYRKHLNFFREYHLRDHTFMTSSRWGEGGQVKNGKHSDGSGWLQGEGEGDPHKLDV